MKKTARCFALRRKRARFFCFGLPPHADLAFYFQLSQLMSAVNQSRKVSFTDEDASPPKAKRHKSDEAKDACECCIVAPKAVSRNAENETALSEMLAKGAFDENGSAPDPTGRKVDSVSPLPLTAAVPLTPTPLASLVGDRITPSPAAAGSMHRAHSLMVPRPPLQRFDSLASNGIAADFPEGFSWERDNTTPALAGAAPSENSSEDRKQTIAINLVAQGNTTVVKALSGKLAAQAASNNIGFDEDGNAVHFPPSARRVAATQESDDDEEGGEEQDGEEDSDNEGDKRGVLASTRKMPMTRNESWIDVSESNGGVDSEAISWRVF